MIWNMDILSMILSQAKQWKYRGMFEVPNREIHNKLGKGLGLKKYNICKSQMG